MSVHKKLKLKLKKGKKSDEFVSIHSATLTSNIIESTYLYYTAFNITQVHCAIKTNTLMSNVKTQSIWRILMIKFRKNGKK